MITPNLHSPDYEDILGTERHYTPRLFRNHLCYDYWVITDGANL